MSFGITCPGGHRLKVAVRYAGKTIRCPKCSAPITIPEFDEDQPALEESKPQPASAPIKWDKGPTADAAPDSRSTAASPVAKFKWLLLFKTAIGAAAVTVAVWSALIIREKLSPNLSDEMIPAWKESKSPHFTIPQPLANKKPSAANETTVVNDLRSKVATTNTAQTPTGNPSKPAAPVTVNNASESGKAKPAENEKTVEASRVRERDIVLAPGRLGQVVVGGSGKYLIATIPETRQVAVVDVEAREIKRLIPVDDPEVLVAAGESKFVVFQRMTNVLSRFDLKTQKREKTVACEPFRLLAMGSSSNGPLLGIGLKTVTIDLESLTTKELSVTGSSINVYEALSPSANGKLFGAWRTSIRPSGMAVLELAGQSLRHSHVQNSNSNVLPSPDGRLVYCARDRFDSQCKPIKGTQVQGTIVPGATGPLFLSLESSGQQQSANFSTLSIHFQSDGALLLKVPGVSVPAISQNTNSGRPNPPPPYQQVFWLPLVDVLATIPVSCDQFIFDQFSLLEELNKRKDDYFFVASIPPSNAAVGRPFSYQIAAYARQGAIEYSLETGPQGMSVSPGGLVTWTPQADQVENVAVAIIKLRDASGQELHHTIKLVMTSSPLDEPISRLMHPVVNPTVVQPNRKSKTHTLEKEVIATSKLATTQAIVSTIPRAREVVKLPAPMLRPVVGGSGQYLVGFLPDRNQIAVLNVKLKKIQKLIPVDDSDVLVAAGETSFVALQRGHGVMSRFNLASCERELTVSCEPYTAIAMGSSSEGPLLACTKSLEILELENFKPSGNPIPNIGSQDIEASADGKVFSCWMNSIPGGVTTLELDGAMVKQYVNTKEGIARVARPSPDGQLIYTGSKRFFRDWQPIDGAVPTNRMPNIAPAATGPFFLSFAMTNGSGRPQSDPTRLLLHSQNDSNPLLTISDIAISETDSLGRPVPSQRTGVEQLFLLLPEQDALISVTRNMTEYVIHHFNIREELDRSETDYLFVTSLPPKLFQRGALFSHQIDVMSKRGGVQFALESAPDGMSISPEGLVTWAPQPDFKESDAVAMVAIQDATGKELAYTIKLRDGQRSENSPTVPHETKDSGSTVRAPAAVSQSKNASATSTQSTAPKQASDNHWKWTGSAPVHVRGEKGNLAAILSGNKLYRIQSDGTLAADAVTVSVEYLYAGLRGDHLIGVAANPTRVETRDRAGSLIRSVALENVRPMGLVLHPTKPICYVTLDHEVNQFRGTFVAIDEQAGTKNSEFEQLGQSLAVDSMGRFLVSTYTQSVHVGDQIVVSPQQRMAPIPRMNPRRGGIPIRPVPVPAAPRVGVRHTYASVAMMLVYDIDSPLQPEFHRAVPLQMPAGQLRMSYDGRRVTSLPLESDLPKFVGCNPLDQNVPVINYEVTIPAGRNLQGSDIVHHPLLPISVVAGAGRVSFLNSDDGKAIAEKPAIELPQLANLQLKRVMFSENGDQILVLASDGSNNHSLVRIAIPLTADEKSQMQKRLTTPATIVKESAPGLADLSAWSGGTAKAMPASEITTNFGDAVVIVRSSDSTGTGFFVGDSGLVLTCAHCVSPLLPVEVVYHPAGKPEANEKVSATVVHRDRRRDLALLKIDVKTPLHSALLADPTDVKSGDEVTIIANPALAGEVLENTVTTGVVSNGKRMIEKNDYIQSSAAVNPGSSGGPMFDRFGRVIGVVVLKAGIDGVGFAVPPTSIAKFLLKATRRDGTRGQLVREWNSSSSTAIGKRRLMEIRDKTITLNDIASGSSGQYSLMDFGPGDQKLLELMTDAE